MNVNKEVKSALDEYDYQVVVVVMVMGWMITRKSSTLLIRVKTSKGLAAVVVALAAVELLFLATFVIFLAVR